MTEEAKKEYLRKNFIQPLKDNLPLNSEMFQMDHDSNNEPMDSFANYIQFDLKALAADLITARIESQDNDKINDMNDLEVMPVHMEDNILNNDMQFNLAQMPNLISRNSALRCDINKIDINIDEYCNRVGNLSNSEGLTEDTVYIIFTCSFELFRRTIRKFYWPIMLAFLKILYMKAIIY